MSAPLIPCPSSSLRNGFYLSFWLLFFSCKELSSTYQLFSSDYITFHYTNGALCTHEQDQLTGTDFWEVGENIQVIELKYGFLDIYMEEVKKNMVSEGYQVSQEETSLKTKKGAKGILVRCSSPKKPSMTIESYAIKGPPSKLIILSFIDYPEGKEKASKEFLAAKKMCVQTLKMKKGAELLGVE